MQGRCRVMCRICPACYAVREGTFRQYHTVKLLLPMYRLSMVTKLEKMSPGKGQAMP
jgi:hypothetical protein